MSPQCVTRDDLDRLRGGELAAEHAAAVQAHLRACALCQRLDSELDAEYDALAAKLRDAQCFGDRVDRIAEATAPSRLQSALHRGLEFPGYAVVDEISRGGQGVVYEALHLATRQRVAIKSIRSGSAAPPSERARFALEMRVLSRIKHPNIVALREGGVSADGVYFVMEFVAGDSLDGYLARRTLTVRDTLALFARICSAVQAAHVRGVIHRDLKPSNIRVDENGEPRVLDFGLAKLLPEFATTAQSLTATGQFVGSLPWASPEQAGGDPDSVDVRTDVHALGATLYHMLTGRPPFSASGALLDRLQQLVNELPDPPSRLRPDLDEDLDAIVMKCLSKDRDDRYQSAGDLLRDVRNYLSGKLLVARADNDWYVLEKTLHGQRVPVLVAMELLYRSLASGPRAIPRPDSGVRLANVVRILFFGWLTIAGMTGVALALTVASSSSLNGLVLRCLDVVFAGAVTLPLVAVAGIAMLRFLELRAHARATGRPLFAPWRTALVVAALVGLPMLGWRYVPGLGADAVAALWATLPVAVFLRGLAHLLQSGRSPRLARVARALALMQLAFGALLCAMPLLQATAPPSPTREGAWLWLAASALVLGVATPAATCYLLARTQRLLETGDSGVLERRASARLATGPQPGGRRAGRPPVDKPG